mmetsp:Transcript_21954/g.70933  ORF Transcript_21954/g.70933 Transcript_21954/m.70933 type:complete len:318 (-) Transcript_21954:431-1384(-)
MAYLMYSSEADGELTGLADRRASLAALLAEAEFLNRTAVVTPVALAAQHNSGEALECSWAKYLDFGLIGVRVVSTDELEAELAGSFDDAPSSWLVVSSDVTASELSSRSEVLIERRWPDSHWHSALPETRERTAELHCVGMTLDAQAASPWFRPSRFVAHFATEPLEALGTKYAALHIRRGDKLAEHPPLAAKTSPEAILGKIRWLLDAGISRLYVAYRPGRGETDAPLNLSPLSDAGFQLFTASSFPSLNHEALAEDNYLLFCVEMLIVDRAAVSVRTFADSTPFYRVDDDEPRAQTMSLVPWVMHCERVDWTAER